jgi:hypothetical protein
VRDRARLGRAPPLPAGQRHARDRGPGRHGSAAGRRAEDEPGPAARATACAGQPECHCEIHRTRLTRLGRALFRKPGTAFPAMVGRIPSPARSAAGSSTQKYGRPYRGKAAGAGARASDGRLTWADAGPGARRACLEGYDRPFLGSVSDSVGVNDRKAAGLWLGGLPTRPVRSSG